MICESCIENLLTYLVQTFSTSGIINGFLIFASQTTVVVIMIKIFNIIFKEEGYGRCYGQKTNLTKESSVTDEQNR